MKGNSVELTAVIRWPPAGAGLQMHSKQLPMPGQQQPAAALQLPPSCAALHAQPACISLLSSQQMEFHLPTQPGRQQPTASR